MAGQEPHRNPPWVEEPTPASAQRQREVILGEDRREANGRAERECSVVLDVDFQANRVRAFRAELRAGASQRSAPDPAALPRGIDHERRTADPLRRRTLPHSSFKRPPSTSITRRSSSAIASSVRGDREAAGSSTERSKPDVPTRITQDAAVSSISCGSRCEMITPGRWLDGARERRSVMAGGC